MDYRRRALDLNLDLGDPSATADTWDSLGHILHHLGRHRPAVMYYHRALDLRQACGERANQAATLVRLGDTHHAAGNQAAARDHWGQALAIFDDLQQPGTNELRAKLDALESRAVPTPGNLNNRVKP